MSTDQRSGGENPEKATGHLEVIENTTAEGSSEEIPDEKMSKNQHLLLSSVKLNQTT